MRPNSLTYFWALSEEIISAEKLAIDIHNGSLSQLSLPVSIVEGETVWISSDQSVWIADARNPNVCQKLLYREKQHNVYDVIEQTILGKLGKHLDTSDPVMNYFCSEENWKILISIIIKLIRIEKISEAGFASIGYIFPKLETRYKQNFKSLLNEYDFATGQGELFFDLHFKPQRWEIPIDNANLAQYVLEDEDEFVPPKLID